MRKVCEKYERIISTCTKDSTKVSPKVLPTRRFFKCVGPTVDLMCYSISEMCVKRIASFDCMRAIF